MTGPLELVTRWETPFHYRGAELRPHYLYEKLGIRGTALVALKGPCDVETEHLVDWEDRVARDFIRAERMIHFLGEFFGMGIREAVWFQRLFTAILKETLEAAGVQGLRREGDDLFVGSGKLSVSIVTVSPVSALLHLGINLVSQGAPVCAQGLCESPVGWSDEQAERWVQAAFDALRAEWDGVRWACVKVRPV